MTKTRLAAIQFNETLEKIDCHIEYDPSRDGYVFCDNKGIGKAGYIEDGNTLLVALKNRCTERLDALMTIDQHFCRAYEHYEHVDNGALDWNAIMSILHDDLRRSYNDEDKALWEKTRAYLLPYGIKEPFSNIFEDAKILDAVYEESIPYVIGLRDKQAFLTPIPAVINAVEKSGCDITRASSDEISDAYFATYSKIIKERVADRYPRELHRFNNDDNTPYRFIKKVNDLLADVAEARSDNALIRAVAEWETAHRNINTINREKIMNEVEKQQRLHIKSKNNKGEER